MGHLAEEGEFLLVAADGRVDEVVEARAPGLGLGQPAIAPGAAVRKVLWCCSWGLSLEGPAQGRSNPAVPTNKTNGLALTRS